jgi:hypothetical protein
MLGQCKGNFFDSSPADGGVDPADPVANGIGPDSLKTAATKEGPR